MWRISWLRIGCALVLLIAITGLSGCDGKNESELPALDDSKELVWEGTAPESSPASAFPLGLPRDQCQPWEELDGSGHVVRGGKAAGWINADSVFVPGVEWYLSGGSVAEEGEAARLGSDGGTLSYAMYRLVLGGEQPGVVTADVNLRGLGSEYYLGLANYARGVWEWHGPFGDHHVRLSTGGAGEEGASYLSSLGNLFIAVVAYGGSRCDVVGVAANPRDIGDMTAPPQSTGLTAVPRAGALELQWHDVIAGDLAGYRICWSSEWFHDGSSPGVRSVPYLEDGRRHLLAGVGGRIYVRVGAVDVSGHEGEPSAIVEAWAPPGAPPPLVVGVSATSGSLRETLSLSASGAEFYDFDVDGDGVFDVAGDTSGVARVASGRLGIIRPRVRGASSGGDYVAYAGVSLIVTGNARPVANAYATPTWGGVPLTVSFSGEGADEDGEIVQYAWDFDGDGTYDYWHAAASDPPPHTYTKPGVYNAKFLVADDEGAWDVDTVAILVSITQPENVAPSALLRADKTCSNWPFIIEFDATGSTDPDGVILKYEFDFDGDGAYDYENTTGRTAHTYPVYGWYPAQLRVTDNFGAVDTSLLHITLPSEWWMFGMGPAQNRRSPYLAAQTDDVRWSYATGDKVRASAAVGADGTVYVGSNDNLLYAINPDGTEKWTYATNGTIRSSPAIGPDGTIYVGSSDDKLHAISPDGTQVWTLKTGLGVRSSPAVGVDGTVYVGSWDGKIYAVRPSGTEKWAYPTGGPVHSSPAIGADGTVYVGSDDGNLYAIWSNGSLGWTYATGDFIRSSPAVGADGTIYVGSMDRNLYAVKADGSGKWTYPAGNVVSSSPAIGADGTIYVGSNDHKLHAVNPDGTKKWAYSTGDSVRDSSPAIGADGTLYVGSCDDKLHAIKPDGTVKWTYTTGGDVLSSPAIGADGTLYVGSNDGCLYAFGPAP